MILRIRMVAVLAIAAACTPLRAGPLTIEQMLPASAADQLVEDAFVSVDQHRDWQVDLDARGLRAAGSPAHEAYIDVLAQRLRDAGVASVTEEPIETRLWIAKQWSLDVMTDGTSTALAAAGYLPYSGDTGPDGVKGRLRVIAADDKFDEGELDGQIVLLPLTKPATTLSVFEADAMYGYDPEGSVNGQTPYVRSYFALRTLVGRLDMLQAAGATGAIIALDEPANNALGTYAPYDAVYRQVPALYVDRDTGAELARLAERDVQVRLRLDADARVTTSRNLIGIIPGASDEFVVLNSHSDGPNGIEDNGPNIIVGMADYLARLPRTSLGRSIMILLTTGHFAGAAGGQAFIDQHADDGLLDRIAAVLCLEHMGAEEWVAGPGGRWAPSGKPEPYWFFMPDVPPLVAAARTALERAQAAPTFIRPPTRPHGKGLVHDHVWPGEGQVFWGRARIPTANYIAGPNYLFNWGISTADKVDYHRLHRETIAFTAMTLELANTPMQQLRPQRRSQ